MSTARFIGLVLIGTPFAALAIAMTRDLGARAVLLLFGAIAVAVALFVAGSYLAFGPPA